MSDKLTLVKNMFEAMDRDWKAAAKTPSRYASVAPSGDPTPRVGDINLRTYKPKFGVSDQDVDDYCATLTPLQPVHPTCILCGREWSSLEKTVKPICGSMYIDWYDNFTMWCCGAENTHHDTVWYYQDKDGHVYFEMEVDNLEGHDYLVRWNCRCDVSKCYGKNIIYDITEEYTHILYGPFTMEEMPYTITRPQLFQLLKDRTPIGKV